MSWIVCGLGPIGTAIALEAQRRGKLLAVVDVQEEARTRAGSTLPAAIPAYDSLLNALDRHARAPVLLCTSSDLRVIVPDLLDCARAGSSVVTTCEEASWPFRRFPEEARRIDEEARRSGTCVLGGGINPGFLMDLLPACLATPFPKAEVIRVTRRVDVAQRRGPLQRKVGVGLTLAEFQEKQRAGQIGHRGLEESIHLLGAALEISWDSVECTLHPVIAARSVKMAEGVIPEGKVIGMRNTGRAISRAGVRLELELVMAYALPDPIDRIEFLGAPPAFPKRIEFQGGVQGDTGTTHIIIALAARVAGMPPGFRTMLDVPGGIRGWWG